MLPQRLCELELILRAVLEAALLEWILAWIPFRWLRIIARVLRLTFSQAFSLFLGSVQRTVARDGIDADWPYSMLLQGAYLTACLLTPLVWAHIGVIWTFVWKCALYGFLAYSIYSKFAAPWTRSSRAKHPWYNYRVLKNDRDIRLLQVQRSVPFGKYSCTILHTSLDTAPKFEAISYTWSGAPSDKELLLNGQATLVTQTVLDIIDSSALFLHPKLLWIDSICINQEDPHEKSRQVAMMRDIFQTAQRVVAWLPYTTFFRTFLCIHLMVFFSLKLSQDLPDEERRRTMRIGRRAIGSRGLLEFLEHSYWFRGWVIQELVLNKNVIVCYGGRYFHLNFIEELVNQWLSAEREVTDTAMVPIGPEQIRHIFDLRTRYHSSGWDDSLLELWRQTNNCNCTDQRDRIYALLGLVSATHSQKLDPDYRKTSTEVFIATARHCFSQDPMLLLGFAGIGQNLFSNGLPSWTPDFGAHSDRMPFTTTSHTAYAYRAAGDSVQSLFMHPDLNVFTTSAIQFDTIDQLSDMMTVRCDTKPGHFSSTSMNRDRLIRMNDFASTNLGSGLYLNGQAKSDVVWRTMMADRDLMGKQWPLPPEYKDYLTVILLSHIHNVTYEEFVEMPEVLAAFSSFKNLSLKDTKAAIEHCGPPEVENWCKEISVRVSRAVAYLDDRRLAVTRRGALGIVPEGSKAGDTICVFAGSSSCWVVRPSVTAAIPNDDIRKFCAEGAKQSCRLVGESYMHGFMDGEVLKEGKDWETLAIW